jgi:hypothetical protein|tara:strand:+ start:516 stop:656 length:141 start_codon:yes stop_codon:yes gene_type:complete
MMFYRIETVQQEFYCPCNGLAAQLAPRLVAAGGGLQAQGVGGCQPE